jgi:hypothetical protein
MSSSTRIPAVTQRLRDARILNGDLTTRQLAALTAWKVRLGARGVWNGLGGYTVLRRRGEKWAAQWEREWGHHPAGLRGWLSRPGAGAFWFPIGDGGTWARARCSPFDLAVATAAAAGTVDLLGSGPVPIGPRPTWRQDLYTGHEWPLDEAHRIGLKSNGGSDIRTVWELSRCYHFIPLARAYWQTGDRQFCDTFVRHVESWIEHNPIGYGPNWASPMDAAIRAANWTVALGLFADAPGIPAGFGSRALANLHTTGLYIERHLEWHPVYRGNHYVSNAVGLVYLGTLFRGTPDGERWLHSGARILTEEIQRQVGEDGVSFEASLAYHRLVTEFFAYAGELIRRNLPEGLPKEYEDRLRKMYRFIAAYLPESGEAPMLGDADDGRLHAVSAEGWLKPRRHDLGLPDHHWPAEPPGTEAFPQGGFHVLRTRTGHAIIRCGRVGLGGAGCHDHNDQLSFELVLAGRRIVADSGTFAYTRDLAARFAFRSTAAHSVVQVSDEEQNTIRPDLPWRVLGDRTRSEGRVWEAAGGEVGFEGRHFGFAHRASGAVHNRRITADAARNVWEIEDRVDGTGIESLSWRLHLGVDVIDRTRASSEGLHEFLLPGTPPVRITLRVPPGMSVRLESSAISDRYGAQSMRPCLTVTGTTSLPVSITSTISVEGELPASAKST